MDLGKKLVDQGGNTLPGGSAAALREVGVAVMDVAEYWVPEIMDGRVKTLHPRAHGESCPARKTQMMLRRWMHMVLHPFDLLVANLYPFEATVAKGADYDTCIENIDIGGPAMIRAAAKNHAAVTVITDPSDYERLLEEMQLNKGATTLDFEKSLAANAYRRTGSL